MRLLLILTMIIVTISPTAAQERIELPGGHQPKTVEVNTGIEQIITGFSETWGGTGGIGGFRPFLATFEFESLPEPLTPVRVSFTLVAQEVSPRTMEQDWDFEIKYDAHHMGISGDTAMTWPGPHFAGETMTGSFEVVPYSTGLHFIELTPKLNSGMGMKFGWHFDLDGNLTYSGKWKDYPRSGTVGGCAFFAEDSVILRGINRRPIGHSMFDFTYSVVPPFKIGQPSRVTYRLCAVQDAPNGIDISFYTKSMKIVELPDQVSYPVLTGDSLDLEITAIPLPVNAVHQISMRVDNGLGRKSFGGAYTMILCDAVFRPDSTLWIIANGDIHDTEVLPTAFREMQDGDRETIRIYKDQVGIRHDKF